MAHFADQPAGAPSGRLAVGADVATLLEALGLLIKRSVVVGSTRRQVCDAFLG
jgi:hypothetical protein